MLHIKTHDTYTYIRNEEWLKISKASINIKNLVTAS